MFLRLLFAFVAFGVLTAALVVAFDLRWAEGDGPPDSGRGLLVVIVAGLVAVGPAWVFARWFVRPFREIRASAERTARGEHGQRIHGGVWRESRELADSFNEMSRRLADQI